MTGALAGATAPVLALRALGLGDALTAVPALRALRRRFPERPLLLAAAGGPPALLQQLGVVDGVVPATGLDGDPPGLSLGRHLAVNLHGRGPLSHRLLAAGRPDHLVAYANLEAGVVEGPRWVEDEHEVLRWLRLVEYTGGSGDVADLRLSTAALPPSPVERPYVVLHPGAASGARRWPADRWGHVAAALLAAGRHVVVTGGRAERNLAAAVVQYAEAARPPGPAGRVGSTAGTLDLPQLAALVAGADLLLCGDTGVAHLGTAFGVPSVLLFGPTPPALWRPLVDADLHTVLWHGVGVADPHAPDLDPALSKIDVQEVVTAARRLLEG